MPAISTVFAEGVVGSRPSASTSLEGYFYFATDVNGGTLYQCKSAAWVAITPGMTVGMTTQDDLIVGGASGAVARLGKGSDGQVLTVDPSTHHLVWATPAAGGMTNPMTTAGDVILGGSSGTPGRLAKGSDSTVLTIDPTSHLPVWAAPAGGSSGLTQLDQVIGNGASKDLHFASISGAYRDLRIVLQGASSIGSTGEEALVTFNSDTGANYDSEIFYATGTTMTAAGALAGNNVQLCQVPGSTSPANVPGMAVIDIPNYKATVFFKQLFGLASARMDTTVASWQHWTASGIWRNTAAISDIKISIASGNWITGSVATLYGIGT